MCEDTRPRGYGCINIGVTGPQIPTDLILFTLTSRGASKRFSCGIKAVLLKERAVPKAPRLNKLQRPLPGDTAIALQLVTVDKVPSSFSSMQSMRHVSR